MDKMIFLGAKFIMPYTNSLREAFRKKTVIYKIKTNPTPDPCWADVHTLKSFSFNF